MKPGAPVLEDRELERLYSQAREYELLTLEQEREIDGEKWAAVYDLAAVMLGDTFSRRYLQRWASRCCQPLPDIDAFANRKHRGLLRRELAEFLPGGSKAPAMASLAEAFDNEVSGRDLLSRLQALMLPASLVVAMAETLVQRRDSKPLSKVAIALGAWEQLWPPLDDGAPEPAVDTVKALARGVERYTAARDRLIVHNLRLVFTIAGRSRNKGVGFLDLVQEGNLGLLRAAEKFHFSRGYRFSTYAFNWISQAIRRCLAETAGSIRFPAHIQEQLGKVHGERARIQSRTGSTPMDTDLARALGLSVSNTRELLQLRDLAVSFDTPRFEEEDTTTLLDSTPGGPFDLPGDEAERSSLHDCLLREIRRLDLAEQKVVIQRWGLHEGPPLTRSEIADQMAVSTEWVRLLERSALEKLKRSDIVNAVYEDHLPT